MSDERGGSWRAGWDDLGAEMTDLGGYLLPPEFWLEVAGDDAPDLHMTFRVVDGRVECSSVELTASDEGREISHGDLRSVAVVEFMERAVMMLAMPVQSDDGHNVVTGLPQSAGHGVLRAMDNNRARVTPARLRRVAEILRSEDSTYDAIQDEFPRVNSRRTAQLWVKRARETIDPDTGRPYYEDLN